MSLEVRVRFAPSPTGFLHVGGARTALFNWLYARHTGGTFVLRVEDTDKARNTDEAVQAIYDGLRWLGIDWDEGAESSGEYGPYFQSQRDEIYKKHLAVLEEKGMVYEDEGAIRFKSPRIPVVVDDLVCGRIEFDRSEDPDMTIRRPDGSFIFHFVSVVDDIEMKISHVIRGEDHLSNTPKHVELYQALGATPPTFAHIPLILNKDGSKMSKRDAGASVAGYIEQGYAPEAVLNYLCLLGWSPKDDREKLETSDVIELFDLAKVNRKNASFDMDKCLWLNAQYMMQMPISRFKELSRPFLDKAEIDVGDEALLDRVLPLITQKVKTFSEVPEWIAYFFDEQFAYDEAAMKKVFGKEGAMECLLQLRERYAAQEDFSADALEVGLKEVVAEKEKKVRDYVHPARIAVSGKTVGPSLYHMLEVMGKECVLARFDRTVSKLGV